MVTIRRVIVFLFPLVLSVVLFLVILKMAFIAIPLGYGGTPPLFNGGAIVMGLFGSLQFFLLFWLYKPVNAYIILHFYLWTLLPALSIVLGGIEEKTYFSLPFLIPAMWHVTILYGIIGSLLLFVFRKKILAVLTWLKMDEKQKISIQLDEKGSIPYELGYGGVVAKVKEEEQQTESQIAADEMPRGSYPEMMQGRD